MKHLIISFILIIFCPVSKNLVQAGTYGPAGTKIYIHNLEGYTPSDNNYYVSKDGDDDNPGTIDEPWLTIQNGLDQLSPGNTLNIMEGTYNEKLFVVTSGTEGNIICIKNYNDDVVIISGEGITESEAIIEIYDVSYITIEGLTLAHSEMLDAKGILIDGNCDNIIIKDNNIYDINFSEDPGAEVTDETNAQPIIVFGSDDSDPIENLVIDHNEIFNSRTGYSEALAVNGNVDGFEVINNHIHDISNIGIDLIGHEGTCGIPSNDQARNGLVKGNIVHDCISDYATSGGIYVDGGKDIIITNNLSYHNGYGIEIGCENIGKTTSNITVRNNLFYNNEICAIAVGGFDYPDGSGKVVDCHILNNTCLKNDFSDGGMGEMYFTYIENGTVENNIFYLSDQDIFAYAELSQDNLQMDYNLFYSESGNLYVTWNDQEYNSFEDFVVGTGLNTNSIVDNPLLVSSSISSPDFHLQNGSPAINAGNPDFIADAGETDLDGEDRILHGKVDIGADESTFGTSISNIKTRNDVLLFPNPGSEFINVLYEREMNKGKLYYDIINSHGKLLIHHDFSNGLIDVSHLNPGTYLIIIKDKQDKILCRGRFIKN